MHTKVSLVMTCYNKAGCIGVMIDSIIAQEWNNIEVIMVDDGSTDGTDKIIEDYIPKLKARGFQVIVHRQENAGVAKASKSGMELITGEYMCLIDADDALNPKYVSIMADFLDKNDDYDVVKCGYKATDTYGGERVHIDDDALECVDDRAIKFIVQFPKMIGCAWQYMVRTSYLHKCGLPQHYYAEIRATQEPSFVLPLLIYNGRLKYLQISLYYYFRNNSKASVSIRSNQNWKYLEMKTNARYDIVDCVILSIASSVLLDTDREKYLFYSKFGRYSELCKFAQNIENLEAAADNYNLCLKTVNKTLGVDIIGYRFEQTGFALLQAIKHSFFEESDFLLPRFSGSVIAYGVLGNVGKRNLRYLSGTIFEPEQLWDIEGDGKSVKLPCFAELTPDDILVIFPLHVHIDTHCHQIHWTEIEKYVLTSKFQEITKKIRDNIR